MLTLLASVSGKMHSSNYFQSDTKVHLVELERKKNRHRLSNTLSPSSTVFGAKIQIQNVMFYDKIEKSSGLILTIDGSLRSRHRLDTINKKWWIDTRKWMCDKDLAKQNFFFPFLLPFSVV